MSNFQTDIQLEKKFSRVIKSILGNYFITQDVQEDLHGGTDFLTYTMSPFKIGIRLRRQCKFFDRYKNEFTIRWQRPSGVETEIHKIRKNLVQYILYGFVDESQEKIIQYFIADLKIFNNFYKEPRCVFPNNPRDSDLAVWRISDFPENFILHFYANTSTLPARGN